VTGRPIKRTLREAILLSEIVDQIFLVTIHPASNSEHEELQRMGHCERLLGRDAAADRPLAIHLASAAFRTLREPFVYRKVTALQASVNPGTLRPGRRWARV